ncbi:MAG: hypothetical protein J4G10_03810 [Alphaproteobacteria bacterium]|nr:hypothetical protein [Alphaproteobacteria bacterium]
MAPGTANRSIFCPAGLLACLAWVAPAVAEDTLLIGGETVTVSRTDCLKITKHVPAADVEYQPGVDVHGRPVAPADVEGSSSVKVPENFTIDITVELDARFGMPATPDFYKPEANIGVVTVEGDQAYFNGQPLATESVNELAEICRKLTKTK